MPFRKPPSPTPPAADVGTSLGILVNIESRCTRTADSETAWISICSLNVNHGGLESKMAPGCSFDRVVLGKYCRFHQAHFRLITWKPVIANYFMSSRTNFFTWLHGWKSLKVKGRVVHIFTGMAYAFFPFYRQVLTPVIPINARHLSRPHGATRAVPHQFHRWVNHPTSHLCFQTVTYPLTHVLQKPPVPPGAEMG